MKQYELFEISLPGAEPEGSMVDVSLTGTFEKDGKAVTVKGFYAGKGIYKVRFLPEEAGVYQYRIQGCVEAAGTVTCEAAGSGRHGIVRAEGTHFRYDDGTWFYPFGTTVYALVHQEEALIEETMRTLLDGPFNKVRMCVFPKNYDYNHNDPPYFAFEKNGDEWDVEHPCFEFWEALEHRIAQLDQMGIQCDLILFHPYDRWGFSRLGRERSLVYLDYAVRRLSAFPNIWWSLANEYELLRLPMGDWECFAHTIHENDVWKHLLSNHNIIQEWDFSNEDTTHICVQSSAVDEVSGKIAKYGKPMMVDECKYEGNLPLDWGSISAFEMVNRFWKVCTQGGYCTHGETYLNEEEILWWSKGGKLIGESPKRIGFLRELLESLPGPLVYGGKDATWDAVKELKEQFAAQVAVNPFAATMLEQPDEVIWNFLKDIREYIGRCEDEVYLKYYERKCPCIGTLELPENQNYTVEVIDVWEMTRKKALEHVSGHVEVKMAGKEGMALLARKE